MQLRSQIFNPVMKQIYCLSAIVWLLLLSACGGDSSASPQMSEGSFALTVPVAQVAARTADFVFVDVQVNGVPAVFILDTGADAFVVSPGLVERAGLRVIGDTRIVTIAGASSTSLSRIDDFRFANVIGSEIDAAVIDLVGIDGIIGAPLFRSVVVSLDYGNGLLELADPLAVDMAQVARTIGGQLISAQNFVLEGVTVNGQTVGPMRIDTGNSGGIRISTSRAGALLNSTPELLSVNSNASNGSVSGTAFIADQVSLDTFTLDDQFVVVQDAPLEVGLLGSLVLQQFYVVFDLSRGQVVLRQDRTLRYGLAQPTGQAT
jgi:predicted aspartyl protease